VAVRKHLRATAETRTLRGNMSGVPSQVVNRLRLFLLAVVCWLCFVPTAQALRPPTPAETQLKEESALPEPSTGYVVCVVDGEMRIGLFVENDPIKFVDTDGLRKYYYDGQQWLYIGPAWFNPFGKGEWYAISPEGAKKLIGRANFEEAISAAEAAILMSAMADGHGDVTTCKDSQLEKDGIDAHDLKEDYVGKENAPKFNIAKDSDGNVYLVPVNKGTSEPVPVPVKYPDLPDIYPLKKE
jgi:Bacterial toxin 33